MARMTKKKVNPTSKCHTKKRRKRIRRNTRKAYSETAIKEALAAIKAGDTLRKASKAHNVPVTTLFRRSKDPNSVAKKSGPPTVLSAEVEQRIVDWIIYRGKRGHPVGKSNIIEGVELYIKEAGIDCKSFVNGKPGRHWYEAFMRRHPELSKRTPQHLTKARYEVDEEDLRQWFHEVKTHLESKNLLNIHPSRIFNCDETNLALCPKSKYVITAKGAKTVYNIVDANEHENLTALCMYSADGVQAPVMTLYPYKEKIPKNIIEKLPSDWAAGVSENGWMTIETFYEYITNIFYPWLLKKNIDFPVILYLDGHSSHITVPLVIFCREKLIELISFVPHSTHIMQPLDIAFFGPLKDKWKQTVPRWKTQTGKTRMKKEDFASVLKMTIDSFTGVNKAITNGFRAAGLVPFNPDAPDYNILDKTKKKKKNESHNQPNSETVSREIDQSSTTDLANFEIRLQPDLLEEFLKCERTQSWTGELKFTGLFEYWMQLKTEASESQVGNEVQRSHQLVSDLNLLENINVINDTYTSNAKYFCEKNNSENGLLNESDMELINEELVINQPVLVSELPPVNCSSSEKILEDLSNNNYSFVKELLPSELPQMICFSPAQILQDLPNNTFNTTNEQISISESNPVNFLKIGKLNVPEDLKIIILNEENEKIVSNENPSIESEISQGSNDKPQKADQGNSFDHTSAIKNPEVESQSNCHVKTDDFKPKAIERIGDTDSDSKSCKNLENLDINFKTEDAFNKAFTLPTKYLPKKRRAKFEKTGKEKRPCVGTSDGWLETELKKEKIKEEKEAKIARKKELQEEKKKIEQQKKDLQQKIKELQLKIKNEKP